MGGNYSYRAMGMNYQDIAEKIDIIKRRTEIIEILTRFWGKDHLLHTAIEDLYDTVQSLLDDCCIEESDAPIP